MTTEEFIREQFYEVLPDGWIVERLTKMHPIDDYDYTVRLYNKYLEHQLDVLIKVTGKGFVEKIGELRAVLQRSTRHICEQFSVAL